MPDIFYFLVVIGWACSAGGLFLAERAARAVAQAYAALAAMDAQLRVEEAALVVEQKQVAEKTVVFWATRILNGVRQ